MRSATVDPFARICQLMTALESEFYRCTSGGSELFLLIFHHL
jgi:hypothetical protein